MRISDWSSDVCSSDLAGFAELFDGRWTILTPAPGTDEAAIDKVADLWRACGSLVEIMEPAHHDMVLAITSHLPHLIAYTRSEERRVGKECVSTCRSRWSPYTYNKKQITKNDNK